MLIVTKTNLSAVGYNLNKKKKRKKWVTGFAAVAVPACATPTTKRLGRVTDE